MGGDKGPAEVVAGVGLALKYFGPEAQILLLGKERLLKLLLKKERLVEEPRVNILHASQMVAMDDKPRVALRRKRNASMFRAIEAVREARAQAMVSCGNTGCLIASGTIRLRPLPGVERPALATIMPYADGYFILLDAGANPEMAPASFVHNAILGNEYAKNAFSLEHPRVGLLTIGTEEGKGTAKIDQAHELLKGMRGLIDYKGLIEGFQVFSDTVDVVLCDGFVGNIALKMLESFVMMLKKHLKDEVTKTPTRWAGVLLSLGMFKKIKDRFNPSNYGGAPLLGLSGNVIKAHGSSDRYAIMNALLIAFKMVRFEQKDEMVALITEANQRIHKLIGPNAFKVF